MPKLPPNVLLVRLDKPENIERARRATDRFRRDLLRYQNFARVITRNPKMKVAITAGTPCTDGSTIWLRPPIQLGDDVKHDRQHCGQRDERKQLRCAACLHAEDVLVTLYHEIAHITQDSFERVPEHEKRRIIEEAVRLEAADSTKRAAKLTARLEKYEPSWIATANKISPFLGVLVNAVEDARVNAGMWSARPGTKTMFDSQTIRVFEDGIEGIDGKMILWKDQPPNAQAVIGIYCKASGLAYDDWLDPEIVRALDDPELDSLCSRAVGSRTPKSTYRLAFPILERLRNLGFCKTPDDPEDDEPEPEPGEGESADSGEDSADQETHEAQPGETEDSPDDGSSTESESEQSEPEDKESDDESKPSTSSTESDEDGEEDDEDAVPGSTEPQDSEDEDDADEGDDDSDEEGGSPSSATADEEDDESDDSEGSSEGLSGEDDGDSSEDEDEDEDDDFDYGDDDLDTDLGDEDDEEYGSDDDDEPSQGATSAPVPGTADADPDPGTLDTPEPDPGPDTADKDTGEEAEERTGDTYDEEKAEEFDGQNPQHMDLPPLVPTTGDPEQDGTAEEIEGLMKVFGRHNGPDGDVMQPGNTDEEAELNRAIVQADYFDSPSRNIFGVNVHEYDKHIVENGTDRTAMLGWKDYGNMGGDITVPDNVLAPALLRARIAFADNRKSKLTRNLKSGRVDAKVLARRVPVDDQRLFGKKSQPGRKDYFVVIGLDISGSTSRGNLLQIIKRAAMAKAEMMHRLGVQFAVYAHSGSTHYAGRHFHVNEEHSADVDIFVVKAPNEAWSDKTRDRLRALCACAFNLDGHTLEFYRKVAEKATQTDKIILYYTDGAMPLENYSEELDILQREIRTCRQKRITLMGVAIKNNDPEAHGLETVRLDGIEDIGKVVKALETKLVR